MYQVTTTANGKTMISLRSEKSIIDLFELGVKIDKIEDADGITVEFNDLPTMSDHSDY
jgi:hypothetical protein